MKKIFCGCLLAILLSSCGQKGPLYLPDAEPAHNTVS
ncbi:MAG: hypothetical protein EB015_20890 [Methylocystaceae bacterium]|nr:hypothetical protein [Methylocystaceae bacterium]